MPYIILIQNLMWNSNLNKINAKSQHLNLLMMGGDFGEISGKNYGEIFR